MYLVSMYAIDVAGDKLDQRVDVFRSDRLDTLFEIVDVSIEGVDIELDRGELVDRRGGYSEGFLETFEDSFAIAVWSLRSVS